MTKVGQQTGEHIRVKEKKTGQVRKIRLPQSLK